MSRDPVWAEARAKARQALLEIATGVVDERPVPKGTYENDRDGWTRARAPELAEALARELAREAELHTRIETDCTGRKVRFQESRGEVFVTDDATDEPLGRFHIAHFGSYAEIVDQFVAGGSWENMRPLQRRLFSTIEDKP